MRVSRRHEYPVDAVAHDLGVAGDRGSHHGGARRECLDQDHPEALASKRRRAEDVGSLKAPPELVVLDTRDRLDPPQRGWVAQVPLDLVGGGSDHLQAGGHVVCERLECASEDRQSLALLSPSHEQHA